MGLAKMQVITPDVDPEDDAGDVQERPEELRLLEAMLFAASEPLSEKDLAARLPQGELPHRWRSVVAVEQGNGRDAQALTRCGRDARNHCLSSAGDADRDRGYSRRIDLEGLDRRAVGDRLDQATRPPQGARASIDLRHYRGVPVAFRARRGRRSARARRAQGLRPARWPPAGRLRRADAVRRSGAARG